MSNEEENCSKHIFLTLQFAFCPDSHACSGTCSPSSCTMCQVNCTGVLLHREIGRTRLLKPEQSAHLVHTNIQLDVGQDFKILIPKNPFFGILFGVWVLVN